MKIYRNSSKKYFNSVSELLEFFYKERDLIYRTSQKTQDLRKIVQINIDRCLKKKHIYLSTLKEIENRDKLKIYGELITSNIYSIPKGSTVYIAQNFYSNDLEEVEIPLNPNLSASENAQKYFKLYNKQKRSFVALQEQIVQNEKELEYLDSTLTSLSGNLNETDIEEIRQELSEQGIIKKNIKNKNASKQKTSKPLHFVSTDGFDIYVGKNNKQNDYLTMSFASNNDMWFHTKDIPGSHVILKINGKDVPNNTLTEAATLAAYYSKAQNSSLVPVDYTHKKHVKKPNGSKPGMVIYENYKTAFVIPDIDLVNKLTITT